MDCVVRNNAVTLPKCGAFKARSPAMRGYAQARTMDCVVRGTGTCASAEHGSTVRRNAAVLLNREAAKSGGLAEPASLNRDSPIGKILIAKI
jgi:hypothetical protein